MIIKAAVCFIWMVAVPFLGGAAFIPLLKKGSRTVAPALIMAAGLMLHQAVFEVMTLLGRYPDLGLRKTCIIFAAGAMLLALFGAWQIVKERQVVRIPDLRMLIKDPCFVLAFLLIAFQIYAILRYATPDPDDAFYSSLSSMSYSYDLLLEKDAYSGLMSSAIQKRYAFSALPVYQAGLSYLSGGLHHLFICHNLFPLFYIPLAYGLYMETVRFLYERSGKDEPFPAAKALLTLAVLHSFGDFYVFTQETFLMTRLWQGKGLFAAIGIPVLFLCGVCAQRYGLFGWIMTAVTMIAIVFMGGTGLFLAPGMLMLLRGAVFLISGNRKKELLNLFFALLCCLPEAAVIIWMMR